MATLADALRQFGPAYLHQHTLSTAQSKAWRAIVACRTAALGGQQLACDTCGHSHWQYHYAHLVCALAFMARVAGIDIDLCPAGG